MKKRNLDGLIRLNLLLATMLLGYTIKTIYDPVELYNPLGVVPYVKAVEQPVETIVEPSSTVSELVDGIHFLETGRGTAKIGLQGICAKQGKSNEYGYGGMKLKICFDSHELARARVERWIVKHLDQFKDEGMTMCYYNLGLKVKDCKYYQNYLAIKSK